MGGLVINHNTSALNTQRNLKVVDKQLKSTLEHLSSGERIVRAADGPATLMISEQMRAQIASVTQAMRNSETSVSMVQTTEAALNEVNRLLVSIRQLAIHAGNEGANDQNMLAADQLEAVNALESIDRISQFAQFGNKKLLDGSNAVTGVSAGRGLTFIGATTKTKQSPAEGYPIRITRESTQATLIGERPLSQDVIDAEVELTVSESGRIATYRTKKGDDPQVVMRMLQNAIDTNGLQLDVGLTEPPRDEDGNITGSPQLKINHKEFGSAVQFTVVSTMEGVLSPKIDELMAVSNGQDVEGTIDGQLAYGEGILLKGAPGTRADGLVVAYEGQMRGDTDEPVGRVSVDQNSLIFQIGPNAGQKVSVALGGVNTRSLGINVPNESRYRSLSDIDLTTAIGAESAIALVDKAIDDVNVVRATLGAVQKNSLEANIRSLGVTHEELVNSESVMRDADMAEEVSNLTRNQIIMQSGMAMLSQANQTSRNVLSLLQGG